MNDAAVKPVRWIASSRKDIKSFPAAVRREIGTALFAAQRGLTDPAVKPLKGFGSGVVEVVTSYVGGTWRTVYTVRYEDVVYVLHAFQKKSKSGVATPKAELDLVGQRLLEAGRDYRRRQN